MIFKVKKTNELTTREITQIVNLFNIVFERSRSEKDFLNIFSNTILGYSFHSLMFDDQSKIVGCNSFIPIKYKLNNKTDVIFANAVDSMVDKEYRDFFNYFEMVITGYDFLKENDIVFVYGFPNENSYLVEKKSGLSKDIGVLNTYVLPIKIGALIKNLKFLNPFSLVFAHIFLFFSKFFAKNKRFDFKIEKNLENFDNYRYSRYESVYQTKTNKGCTFTYRIKKHNDIDTAFIIDINPKTEINYINSVSYILKNESKNCDLIMYIGKLPTLNIGLLKVPKKFEPKNFYFNGNQIDNKSSLLDFYDISSWDINLSNYDII